MAMTKLSDPLSWKQPAEWSRGDHATVQQHPWLFQPVEGNHDVIPPLSKPLTVDIIQVVVHSVLVFGIHL